MSNFKFLSNPKTIAIISMAGILFCSQRALANRNPPVEYAGDLYRLCKESDDNSKAVCFGFIAGVFEVAGNNRVDGITSCIPPFTKASKAQTLALQWISDHHSERGMEPASTVIAKALASAFPCGKVK